MKGIDIKIDYVAARDRVKALFAPFALLPVLLLLYLWVGQNNIVNFVEYKVISAYDSSFALNPSSLDQDTVHKLQDAKTSSAGAINTKSYATLTVGFITSMFTIWAMLFISVYALLYSLLLFIPVAAFLLCKNKYPGWIYNWNKEVVSYLIRVISYFLLVSPNYPEIEDEKDIKVIIPEPDSNLSRWKPLFKWFLVIPHALILLLLFVVLLFVSFYAYIYTIITGVYPRTAFNYIIKYLRWNIRVVCYSNILVTDEYPPFSFK